jgi:hypothetical protein
VDALRGSSRDTVPLQLMELGRILRGIVDDGGDVRFLRHYARRLGYLDRVDAAMSAEPLAADAAGLLQLRAGFRA